LPTACIRCGKNRHPTPVRCPVLKGICHKCNRKGHYSSQYLSKTVATAEEIETGLEEAAVTTIRGTPWISTRTLEGKSLIFKLDTGAKVSAISEKAFHILTGMKLQKPSIVVYRPACQPLEVLGQFTGKLRSRTDVHTMTIFVVRGLQNNLVGLSAIQGLRLV